MAQLMVVPCAPLCPLQMEGCVEAVVASHTLVALSQMHFSLVMYELQLHLRPLNLTDEFVIITLAKLATGNGGRPGGWRCPLLTSASCCLCRCLCPPSPTSYHFPLFLSSPGILSLHPWASLSPVTILSLLLPPISAWLCGVRVRAGDLIAAGTSLEE